MSGGHAERTHALLSPSGAHRWMVCTPSARLEEQFPQSTSDYAEEGTLAHELCEVKLRAYIDATPKRTVTAAVNKLKKNPLWQDEMMGHAETYVDYIKATALSMPEAPHIVVEKRVDLTTYIPDGSGIADCILIGGNTLHVIDFKYGKGVPVDAYKNPQLLLYALGAYDAYKILYPIERIKVSIVQPRLSSEPSVWETSVIKLHAFSEAVKKAADLAAKGEGKFVPDADACRFCRARKVCRARAEKNVKLAFESDDNGVPVIETPPDVLGLAEIGKYLACGVDVAKWLDDLKDYALSQALMGHEVEGWKAVEGRGSRDWTDQEAAFKAIVDAGTPETMLYVTNPLSLAQVEKVVGKKQFEDTVGHYVEKKPGKPTLVPASDKREAISNVVTAAEAFK